MVNWLNQNQGFVMSILTTVYVVATIVIVRYSRKSIKEMIYTREAETRPYILAYLDKEPRDSCFFLRVKNYGKTGAKISSIEVNPNLSFLKAQSLDMFLGNVILPPEKMLYFAVSDKFEDIVTNEYSVKISYSSVDGKRTPYTEEYKLVLLYAQQQSYIVQTKSSLTNAENALEQIAEHLDTIKERL